MLVLVFLIPVAYGVSVSISGTQSGSSFFDTTTFNAQNSDSLSANSIVNGAALEQYASGSGNLHKSFGAFNHRGEKAQITANVVNAGSWEYIKPIMAVDDLTASVTGFVLTANDAYTIKCSTIASDRRGDKAIASVEVYRGSLSNYCGDAYASSGGVQATQSFEDAKGAQVTVKERASNPTGYSITNTNIQNGRISYYNDSGLTFADPESVRTAGQFENAYGSIIGSGSSAYRTCGFRSNAEMNVVGTKTQNGQVSGYGSAAGVGLTDGFGLVFETGAQQILSGGAKGNAIELTASSSNKERDISSLKTDIRGKKTEPGFISGYADLTESFRDSVFADNILSQTKGNEIHLSSSSSNKKNDRANANMHAVGDGQIINYMGSSSATAQTASASNNIFDGILAGKIIRFDVSSFDAARNRAILSTEALGGSISGTILSSSDITADELIAAHIGNDVSGSSMQVRFDGKDMATGETAHDIVDILNPSNLPYSIVLTIDKTPKAQSNKHC